MSDLTQPLLGKNPSLVPISNSELQCFKSCKRKWWLAYYRGLKPKTSKSFGPLALGTRLHAALEGYYADNLDLVQEYIRLLQIDRVQLTATEQDTTKFDSEGELGRIMLEGYVNWLEETGADSGLEIVGAEKKVSALLMDGKVELRGKLDLRVKRKVDNVRLFLDHKSVATFESITRTAHMSEQGMMYQLLETLTTGEGEERCDGLIYNMLRKVKRSANARPPFYERLEVHWNRKTMQAFWSRLHGTISEMLRVREQLDKGADHTYVAFPTPTQDCTWKCEFFAVCPLFDDGSAAEELIDTYYTQDDPYTRYENEMKVSA
jgi:hypothetical protein